MGVSFAVVNEQGPSQFSEAVTLDVHGYEGEQRIEPSPKILALNDVISTVGCYQGLIDSTRRGHATSIVTYVLHSR